MGKADLHIHSICSHDSSNSISAILYWAVKATDLDVIAVTDHDKIDGALEARERAAGAGLDVIPAIEVTTAQGHLLALFVEKPIPAHRPFLETILRVGEQGGICLAAHPMALFVHGASERTIRNALNHPDAAKILVGLESCNTGLWFPSSNAKTASLASQLRITQAGGSDSHLFWTIGWGYTAFEGHTALDLRRGLENHTTQACQQVDHRTPGYYAGHFLHFTMRKMGWATWSPEIGSPLMMKRVSEIRAI